MQVTRKDKFFIEDKEEKSGIVSAFRSAVKAYKYFFHIVFLECCKEIGAKPSGLKINKNSFILFENEELSATWKDTIESTESQLLDILLEGLVEKMMSFEKTFWKMLLDINDTTENALDLTEWWVKLSMFLNNVEEKEVNRKRKKIRKLATGEKLDIALKRFDSHMEHFEFKHVLEIHGEVISPDMENIITLATISNSTDVDEVHGKEDVVQQVKHEEDEFTTTSVADSTANGRLRGVFISKNILNLSKRILNKAEISILSKGLKFVPTPKSIDRAAIKNELEVFGRKLRLAWHFRNDENSLVWNRFRKKSNFNPKDKDAAIEIYISRLEQELLDINTNLKYHNITREEREAINTLRNDTSIIIKEADKGSGIVVWDRDDYLKEAELQLGDIEVYEKLSSDSVSPLIREIKNCLAKINKRGDISKETLDYFLVDNPKVGRFYLLPKIHKRLENVPGRPVISNSSFYTENISTFLDFHFQPIAQQVKSFIKDTNDFLKKLPSLPKLSENTLLCTAHVVGLYPNIPHDDGLKAIEQVLNQRDDFTVSTKSLLDLTECVLKNNVFEHNDQIFKQKRGTAIGTKMAPSYAIIFMSILEEKLLETFPLKPLVWWRYIDDIFFLWDHGEDSLKDFLHHINTVHPTIKFTSEYSKDSVNFLDVQVLRRGDKLVTDLFVKETDRHQYLDPSSCHPIHCINSIPYSQALRLNRICSENSLFDKRCNELESWLLNRGYNDRLVREKILIARRQSRDDLLYREKPARKSKLVFNITYHPSFNRLSAVLRKIQIILACDKEHQNVFPDIPILGFRKGKSLKDMLVRAKVPKSANIEGTSEGCQGKRCGVCPFIKSTSEFQDKKGKQYTIRNNKLTCNSTNVVYLLSCKVCKSQYVGSCTTKFRLRFNNYKSCHKRHKNSSVPQQQLHNHFDEPGHSGFEDWEFTLIDQGRDLESVRKSERFWQYKLDTFLPNGFNDCEVAMPT